MSPLRNLPLLLALVFFGIFAAHGRAQAACGTLPYTFVNGPPGVGSTVDANTTNANNNFLLGCSTTVDNTQIGPNGIYASQIICMTVAQCTFGGTQTYTFPAGLKATEGGVTSFVPPGFTGSGAALGSSFHLNDDVWSCSVSITAVGYYICSQVVTPSGSSAFASRSSFSCSESSTNQNTFTGSYTYELLLGSNANLVGGGSASGAPFPYQSNAAGLTVAFGYIVHVTAYTSTGTVSLYGTYQCSGT